MTFIINILYYLCINQKAYVITHIITQYYNANTILVFNNFIKLVGYIKPRIYK